MGLSDDACPDAVRTLRVLVVDERSLVRVGLCCLLGKAKRNLAVEQAASPSELAVALGERRPDVVLLDAELGGRPLAEAVRVVREEAPGTRVIVLGLEPSLHEVRQAFAGGADGYVTKEGAVDELVTAIDEVAAGRRYLDPRLGAELVVSKTAEEPGTRLTSEERRVLRFVARGLTNREIAERLGRPLRTVEGIRARGQRKLGTSGRAELVELAERNRI